MFTLGDERETMLGLNGRLASYMERVRSLEEANCELELQIHEVLEKRGPEVKDYSHYDAILEDLRTQILGMILGNENLAVRINKLNSEAEDFQMKVEIERRFRQSVEADIAGLRNVLDTLHQTRMKLESDIEALSEDLILLKKNHEEEILELHIQIEQSGVRVDVDAPTGEDLGQIIGEIRAKFEKMALKNQEELKACHGLKVLRKPSSFCNQYESQRTILQNTYKLHLQLSFSVCVVCVCVCVLLHQVSEVEAEVAESMTALQGVQTERKEKHRLMQSLEIEMQSQRSQKASLEGSLQDTELHYSMEMEENNNIILHLEAELMELRTNIHHHTQEYEALLSLKTQLEAEIATYRGLLDGGDFKLEDALE
ncbi:keratin, type I cytoskeletal 18-like isoform X1 [Conger conger]|uniref:keratin, type I cytoskeletal 18-like isoform X1 n=1 Tax=Conger conger TaxID=82655 RepID=UPI002A5A4F6F|nr:keratin, type I cytoskeletal 18-like isoform X1 [Conger conger]